MTELLHTITTDRPGTPRVGGRGAVVPVGMPGDGTAADPRTTRERPTRLLQDGPSGGDLAALSTRQLRILANDAYRCVDVDHPPAGAAERYESVVDELDHRARQAADRGSASEPRESFRDNPLYCRFELFVDGRLAAYLKYSIKGGRVSLIDGVEQTGFRDQGFDMTLMRHVMLNLHRRRLNVVPQCPMAFSFLADNPEYQLLVTRPRA